jgi:hypothetical protein
LTYRLVIFAYRTIVYLALKQNTRDLVVVDAGKGDNVKHYKQCFDIRVPFIERLLVANGANNNWTVLLEEEYVNSLYTFFN